MSETKQSSFARKAGNIMWTLISILVAFIILLVIVLQIWSYPGQPKQFVDENGDVLPDSISEKIYLDINGVEQGMFIKGKDVKNPVLLYLHGGMPDYFLTEKYPTGLDDYFTVVWWEQRGTGISYSADIPRESITTQQMISDTLELTNYLRQRFNKDKIYLMGHSGGTFFGIQVVAQHPELYYAYIGVAQMSNQLRSEKIAYDFMLEEFKKNGNTKMVKKLEGAPVTETNVPLEYQMIRDVAMHSLGIGTTHDMDSIVTGIVLPSWQSRDYTLGEKFKLWRGKAAGGISALWSEVMATDLSQEVTEFAIPIYFMEGVYDYTCVYSQAKAYFDVIDAPVKGFYTFQQSAHSPMFEEPEKVQRIIVSDILTGTNLLADVK